MNNEAFDTLWYWINERHRIYLKKEAGEAKPWTTDPILQEWKFCNVFRELDKTSVWVIENIINPHKNELEVLMFNLAFFRYFNRIETGKVVGYIKSWNVENVLETLLNLQFSGVPIFTSAYMITCGSRNGKGRNKAEVVLNEYLSPIWNNRYSIISSSLEETSNNLRKYPGWKSGGFMAYEVVTDLTYTPILRDAPDRTTWANIGPGARRGLNRIFGSISKEEELNNLLWLLSESPKYIESHVPKLDLRAVEHVCCEVDKYLRVKKGEGRPRQHYHGH